jgi:hypothetical protein
MRRFIEAVVTVAKNHKIKAFVAVAYPILIMVFAGLCFLPTAEGWASGAGGLFFGLTLPIYTYFIAPFFQNIQEIIVPPPDPLQHTVLVEQGIKDLHVCKRFTDLSNTISTTFTEGNRRSTECLKRLFDSSPTSRFQNLEDYDSSPTSRFQNLEDYIKYVQGKLEGEAESKGKVFFNGPTIDLTGVIIEDEVAAPCENAKQLYRFTYAEDEYLMFKAFGDSLDKHSPLTLREEFMRKGMIEAKEKIIDMEHLVKAPFVARIGTVTVFCICRAPKKPWIVGAVPKRCLDIPLKSGEKLNIHFVGAGPTPEDKETGLFQPLVTSERETKAEMGVELRDKPKLTGIFIDQERFQLLFTYIVLANQVDVVTDNISDKTIKKKAENLVKSLNAFRRTAPEGAENTGYKIFQTGEDCSDIFELLAGTHSQLQLATNHAVAALFAALSYIHGTENVDEILSGIRSKKDKSDGRTLALITPPIATAALVFSLIGNFWCNYAYTPLTFTNTINCSNSSTYNMYHGIWN